MADVIKPTFGGSSNGGGGEPPKPPTYEELMFALEQQRELVAHLRRMLVSREEDSLRLKRACELAVNQITELMKLQIHNSQVAALASKNFKDIIDLIPK
jgi:hypothetical protein